MKPKYTMDLTEGSVVKQLLLFALPILATNILQHLYNAADVMVVGKFATETALAAVGSTGSLTVLVTTLFTSLAIGTNVSCANHFGARRQENLRKSMHTSMILGLVSGILLMLIGMVFARPLLEMMGSPENVIDQATLYMRIIFCGIPASMLYNFASAILRAHGDTKRPMIILSICGLVNVGLNLVFVIFLSMDVAGVALATIISQYLSMAVALYLLFDKKGECAMTMQEMHPDWQSAKEIISVGIPSGINGIAFSLSNVILQSTINSFGDIAMAGEAAASSIAGFVYWIPAAFGTASVSFTGQCCGARKYDRVDKLLWYGIGFSCLGVALTSVAFTIFAPELIGCYSDHPEVITMGAQKLILISWSYLIFPLGEVGLNCLRGLGHSAIPTVMNVGGICATRLLWIFFVFPLYPTLLMLNVCFPVSWAISGLLQMWYYYRCRKHLQLQHA